MVRIPPSPLVVERIDYQFIMGFSKLANLLTPLK
jgi:hypothetical protein